MSPAISQDVNEFALEISISDRTFTPFLTFELTGISIHIVILIIFKGPLISFFEFPLRLYMDLILLNYTYSPMALEFIKDH